MGQSIAWRAGRELMGGALFNCAHRALADPRHNTQD
jgi:hypothetical protein